MSKGGSRGIKVLFGIVIILVMIRLFMGKPAEVPQAFAKTVSMKEALVQASKSGMPVLVLVTTQECGFCESFKRHALADAGVATWIKDNTHPVYVDATNPENSDAERLEIQAYPTLVMLRNDLKGQREVARLEGEVKAKELLDWLADFSGPVQDYYEHHGKYPRGYEKRSAAGAE